MSSEFLKMFSESKLNNPNESKLRKMRYELIQNIQVDHIFLNPDNWNEPHHIHWCISTIQYLDNETSVKMVDYIDMYYDVFPDRINLQKNLKTTALMATAHFIENNYALNLFSKLLKRNAQIDLRNGKNQTVFSILMSKIMKNPKNLNVKKAIKLTLRKMNNSNIKFNENKLKNRLFNLGFEEELIDVCFSRKDDELDL